MIPSALRRASFVFALLVLPQVAFAQFTIQRTSSPIFYNDVGNNPSLQCMYASYEVTNTGGSTVNDVWVDATNFTGGVVTLAPSEDGLVELGAMAPGQKKTAYFYLQGASTTLSAQHHTIHVYASRPPAAPALTQAFSITSVQSTINANANKVTTVVSGPNPPQVGGIVTITVTGQTGTIGAPPMLAFSPAADLSWSAGVFEMISSQITFSGSANAGVITDSLICAPTSSSNTDYVAVYTLRAAGSRNSPTFVSPIGYFASGSVVKHTDTGNYGGFTPIPPPESRFSLTKSATPNYLVDGGISTYTVHLVNSGFASGTVDDFQDVLPGASTIVPGSSTLDGAPIPDPSMNGQTASWFGPFTFAPNSSRDLVYQLSFPLQAGVFVNQAVAHVGLALIDSTEALTDSLPAHAPVEVYVHNADISITKGDAPDPVGPDSTLTYTLVVANAGPDTAFATTAVDTLPGGVNFVQANATVGSASESGGIVSANIGTLAPGESSTITIVVVPTALGTLVNRAHATNARVDYFPNNNTATATTTVATPPAPDLQLVKRAPLGPVTVGQLVSWTLTATNLGTGPTQATITLVDSLPAGTSFVAGSGPGWTVSELAGLVTATNPGPIAVGDSSKVTIQAVVTAAAFPGIANYARSATYHDASAANDTSSTFNVVVSAPDIQTIKRHAGDFSVGSPGQYAITVTNVGNLPALSTITVVDSLPNGLSYVSSAGAGWTINEASGVVTATFPGPLAAGDSSSFTIDVAVSAAAVPGVVNAATSSTAGDVGALNDRGVDPTNVLGFPDVQMKKRAVSGFQEGAVATWTLTATNVGSGATTAPITITDTLAPGATFLNATGAGFVVNFANPTVTATYAAALAPGDSATVTITARLGAAAVPAIVNTAVAANPGDTSAGNDSSTTNTPVSGAPNLRIAKTHAADFIVGQPGQYAITVWNDGSVATSGLFTVEDTLPAGLTFSNAAGTGWNFAPLPGNRVLASRFSALAPGDSASFTITVNVAQAAAPSVVNSAVVTAGGDNDPTNDRAVDPTNVIALSPDLQVIKRAPGQPFTVGGVATYTITLTNTGTGPTSGAISVRDSLPQGLTYITSSGAGFTLSAAGGVVTGTSPGPIAAGDSVVISIDAQVDASAWPSVANTATGSTPGDPDPTDDTSTIVTAVTSAPDVRIEKTHAAAFQVGQVGQYRITVFNIGSLPTPSTMVVRDTLPNGLTYVAGNGASWSFVEASGIVDATHGGPIAPGDSATFTLDVTVGAAAFPAVTNTAVALTIGDVDAGNDRAVDPTAVQAAPTPDLQMVKRAPAAPFTAGTNAQYVLTVTNVGAGPTTGPITITDTLPAGLTFVSGAGAGWIVNQALGVVTATNAGPLAAGDSAQVAIDVAVSAAAIPSVSNSATVATAGDSNPANDTGGNTSAVLGAPDLQLAKRHSGAFTVGGNGTYDFAVVNVGAAPTAGTITVVDSLPAGLTFVSGNGAGWNFAPSGTIVTATHPGPIAAGDSLQFSLDVAIGAAALPGVTNVAVAQLAGDPNPGNDRASDATAIGGVPDVALVKTHAVAFTVGQDADYRIAAFNVGSAATTGAIVVRDTLQTGLGFVSVTGAGWTTVTLGNVVTVTHAGTVAVGDSATFTLRVHVFPAAYPSVGNAAVAQTPNDSSPGNDRGVDPPSPVAIAARLALEKTASPTLVEPADIVNYTLVVRNLDVSPVPGIVVNDTLPVGFRYAGGTATVNGTAIADPLGAPGAGLAFAVGSVPANGSVTLRYRALVGTAAVLGDGVNRAFAENTGLGLRSNLAVAKVEIKGGVFADDGVIAGKVFADCDCATDGKQTRGDLGVPGVRVYLEDGRSAVTDVEGKYHFEAVDPRLHTVKLDRSTLPAGARPVASDSRAAGDAGSRFADMKDGELFRADFALGNCDAKMADEIHARRELGEVRAAIETAQPTTAANVFPGATRVLDGPAWDGSHGAGAFTHLETDGSLNAANSRVPDAPGTPGILAGTAPSAGGFAISVPRRAAPADGRTLVPVTVTAPGDAPTKVTLDSDLGLWQVADQDPKVDGVQTTITHQATFLLVAPPQAGDAVLRVTEVTAFDDTLVKDVRPHHEAEAAFAFYPAPRPWLIAGTIEGRYDGRSLHDDELVPGQLRDRFEDAFATISHVNDDGTGAFGGRGAVFARGTFAGDALLTLRYDSEHAHDRRRFDDIRPDEGDNVFGDASIAGFEAQSTERLFARVDKGRSYALYGDFMTEGLDPIRMLGAYTRGINGAHAHGESGKLEVDAFASHDRDRQVVDEFAGRGVSGPYPLSRKDGVLNSERVEVVTRDRNNPSVILTRKTLVRFADYTIEPFTGRLLFRMPIASLDERLNPVSIRVSYEVEGGGDRFWTAGGSAHLKPVDRVELMGNYVKEDDPLLAHEQYGAGTTLRVLDRTFVTGEWAHTDSSGTITANAYRGEIRHAADKLDLRAFALRTDALFDNRSSGFAPGREEWGGAARYALDRKTSIAAEGVRTKDVVTGGRRKGASLALDRRLSSSLTFGLGYRWARESAIPAGGGPAVPTPNETDAARARLALQLGSRTSAFAEYEKAVAHGSAKRFALGGDVRVSDQVRAYARHEFLNGDAGPYALNEAQELQTTVFGFAADTKEDLSAFSEYRIRDAFDGRNAEAAVGLRDRWRLSSAVRATLSLERVSPKTGPGVTAIASGLEWTGDPLTKGSLRLEFRKATNDEQWLASGGVARKLGHDWTGLARTMWAWAPGHKRTVARDELAFALRETDVNRWNLLGRFEHRLDDQPLDPAGTNRHEVWLASTRFNVRAAKPLTLMGRLAGKWTFDDSQGRTLDGRAALAGARALWDLSPRFDLGLSARSRFDGGWDKRTYGLGAELGVSVARNLRVSGGYNAFGFKDPDFASMERMDKGPFVTLGFKFDEGLFGGKGDAPAPPAGASAESQRGMLVTPPGETLHAREDRLSDEAIAADVRTIDGWRARVDALPDSAGIYGKTKARAWLDVAHAAYVEGDVNGDAGLALANAVALQHALAAGDTAAIHVAAARPLRGRLSGELVSAVTELHASPGFSCAQEEVARTEVEMAWAAIAEPCRAKAHEDEAHRLADEARKKADDCIKAAAPPAPEPVDTLAAPVAPNEEIAEALREIPSGIHFALNRHDLSPTSKGVIARIAAVLVKYPNVRVDLVGHTDSRGSVEYNLALSKRRADSVKAGLVAAGVDSSRISASFAGKSGLLNAEQNVTDLALNRRVDFKYYDQNGAEIAQRKQTGDIQVEKPKPVRRPRKAATKP